MLIIATHTLVVPHLELRKIVPKHPVVGIVAVVVGRAALFSRLANAVQLLGLRRTKVLALLRRLPGPQLIMVDGISVSVVLVGLAVTVKLLGEVGDPARDRLLRLLEALLDVFADLGEVIYATLALPDNVLVAGVPSKKLCSRSGSLGR